MTQAGVTVAGTERTVTVLENTGRDAVVADIVPEERWTRPIPSDTMNSKIYVRPGATFFVTLARTSKFDEEDFLAVVDPQARAVEGHQILVRRGESDVANLVVRFSGMSGEEQLLSREKLKVEQTGGSAFGYRVRQAAEGEKQDLFAFRIAVPTGVARGWIASAGAGKTDFLREFVPVPQTNGLLAAFLALLPITFATGRRLIGVASNGRSSATR